MEAISRRGPSKAWLLVLLMVASAPFFVLPPRLGSASPESVLAVSVGIDANPGATPANTATTLGTIESCRVVNNGDTFTVDFYVMNIPVPGIEAFQADLNYTSSKLKVTANNVVTGVLLSANAGSSVSDLTNYLPGVDLLPDTDGKFTPIAADFGTDPGHTETGSGVLARVTLQAIANGAATLTLTNVKLADPSFTPIGDSNGDGVFDGAIANAHIAIGGSCVASSVGGIAVEPDLRDLPAAAAGSDTGAAPNVMVASALAAALAAVGGTLYLRRRWRARAAP